MPDEQLTPYPLEPQYEEKMRALAAFLDYEFNGELRGDARTTGFVLLVFPYGDDPKGRCNYISNGADRRDMVKLLREQANHFDRGTM